MTQPTPYNKTTDFAAHSTANPTTPHSGVEAAQAAALAALEILRA